jgi:hypothetical protein
MSSGEESPETASEKEIQPHNKVGWSLQGFFHHLRQSNSLRFLPKEKNSPAIPTLSF